MINRVPGLFHIVQVIVMVAFLRSRILPFDDELDPVTGPKYIRSLPDLHCVFIDSSRLDRKTSCVRMVRLVRF